MTSPEAVFLGLLQGATEFLPVSSSGHLLLAEHFLGLAGGGLAFDVMLHLGTLAAVLLYFRREWWHMAEALVPGRGATGDRRLLALLVLATIPGGVFGYLLDDLAATTLRSPWVVAATLAGVGALFLAAEGVARRDRTLAALDWRDAAVIGLAQALAIVPGVSRSGITMTAALFLGFRRAEAARFSFLLSAPIIAGAGLHEGHKLLNGTAGPGPEVLWGTLAAFVAGYAVISWLLAYLARHTFHPFAYYRIVLAGVVAALLLWGSAA
ncbi:undecaprenyl-diphosphatase UppP [Dissulfurirhabdus thermomarina]|uniref:Undecaprenyl-diphosphatase n=1 Tax=Dissulfurirhabdus thermomarina TaxID=1765737 RepID=A0A6N9TNL2_DISTH|nr:undecaprenyl-diphosphatase UppP [Dissulfurirhabdus thermomarina]NDY41683.1 undecaprenyl-diphosphatase UppP [Dissulfurirhabdus thermomarina]NMX22749.1 undecaprenyl-diphosphatase UppP [Dissulfurirhabdus thermomarina]